MTMAVAESHIANYTQNRPGFSAGVVNINVMRDITTISPAAAGFTGDGSAASWATIAMPIADLQDKRIMSGEIFRNYYLSKFLSPSANVETIPDDNYLLNLISKEIDLLIEKIIWYGDAPYGGSGVLTGIVADTYYGATGSTSAFGQLNLPIFNGVTGTTGASGSIQCWTADVNLSGVTASAITQIQAMVDAVPDAVLNRDDLVLYTSNRNYRKLIAAMWRSNFYAGSTYNDQKAVGLGADNLGFIFPGTNIRVVPFAGLGSSCRAIIGPKEYFIYAYGLKPGMEFAKMEYLWFTDSVQMMFKFRVGAKIAFPENWVTNSLA